ncbi:MAG: alpha-E domain-containing protein, partial [Hyphomicrobiales bacterium]|nr:alpha-E domain-containing protein [Hyphomicrobiales bacterium]
GGSLDYFQWASILRSVNALTSFHWVYRKSVEPWLVADFLILRPEQPRSLISCYLAMHEYLDKLADAYGRQGPAQRQARATVAKLSNLDMETLFQAGLHEFLTEFIAENNRLGEAINQQYLA